MAGGRVVVGVDGSACGARALAWAAEQATRTGAALEMVTAWQWPTSYGWALPLPSDFDPASGARQVQTDALTAVRADHPDLNVTEVVAEGSSAQVLIDRSEDADLLVVGSRGHGELTGMLVGSVSEHCVAHAHCPVVVVREDSRP
jgi:nucleotide-binding universal stress UspA family protein